MDQRPIGVFDSGLGGLTAVRRLQTVLPGEDIVFLGDTGRLPYGGRDPETLRSFAREALTFLIRQNVKAIVVACGTISSVAPDLLEHAAVPTFGVVMPAVCAAAAKSKNRRIGILGTEAAIRAGAYARLLRERLPDCRLEAAACPRFVPLIEGGASESDPELLGAAEAYLQPICALHADTVILGCTHYPLIAPALQRILGDGVQLIDPAAEAVGELMRTLHAADALRDSGHTGLLRCFVTGSPARFSMLAERFLPGISGCCVRGAAADTQE